MACRRPLGGQLEVTVRFPDYAAPIAIRSAKDTPQKGLSPATVALIPERVWGK